MQSDPWRRTGEPSHVNRTPVLSTDHRSPASYYNMQPGNILKIEGGGIKTVLIVQNVIVYLSNRTCLILHAINRQCILT
jgi:hypothetical protein